METGEGSPPQTGGRAFARFMGIVLVVIGIAAAMAIKDLNLINTLGIAVLLFVGLGVFAFSDIVRPKTKP